MLWDPPTGSWCFLAPEDLPVVEALMAVCDARQWDRLTPDGLALLDDLHERGLVSREGAFAWRPEQFQHHRNKVNTIILKIVGFCNIGCSYCYDYAPSRYSRSMSLEDARRAVRGAWPRTGDSLNVLFHGGEPTLGKDMIFALVPELEELARADGKKLHFSIQTNGLTLDETWCRFLDDHDFSVGVSLDGPAELNDLHRVTRAGSGTYDRVIALFRRHPSLLRRLGVLTTVTSANAACLLDVALHFQALGVKTWNTTLFQAAGRSEGLEDAFEPEIPIVVGSYLTLLRAVEEGRFPSLAVQNVLSYVRNVLGYERRNMCLRGSCGAGADLVSISVDGSIEACDCITDPALRLGKLSDASSVAAALDSTPARSIRARSVETLTPCRNCDWRAVCGGSCLAKAGLDGVDPLECALSMAMFEAVIESLGRGDALLEYAARQH